MDNFYRGCPPKMNDARFLTDYRSATTREQFIKTVNGFVRDDDYRMFLQQKAEDIIDRERHYVKKRKECPIPYCIHKYPTRITNGEMNQELKLYNGVKRGRIKPSDSNYPKCDSMHDYYTTFTKNTKF